MVYTAPNGRKYRQRNGSRAMVMSGTAFLSPGDKPKSAFKYNRHGKIVAKSRSNKNMLKRLTDAGYRPFKKGASGVVTRTATSRSRSRW